jgi:hypothetical protein
MTPEMGAYGDCPHILYPLHLCYEVVDTSYFRAFHSGVLVWQHADVVHIWFDVKAYSVPDGAQRGHCGGR